MKAAILRLSLALVCLFFVPQLFAQSADVTGVVMDRAGAVIPHAAVRLVNQETLVERKVTTNGDGVFSAPFVRPGTYQLSIEAPGFATEVLHDIKINAAAKINIPVRLQLGLQTQEVQVDASGLYLNTTDASVGTVIDGEFVRNIPLNGLSLQDLLSLTPGVVTQSPQSNSTLGSQGDFSVNGQRTQSNVYTVDGVSANANPGDGTGNPGAGTAGTLPSATALGTTQNIISVAALQEAKVQSSSYSAEYGRSPGGQFIFTSKSGTDHFHGSVFDYVRNDVFDANDWFNNHYGVGKPSLTQNDFGGLLGGPIWLPHVYDGRGKGAFFFVAYEGLRLDQPQAATIQYVPDAMLRQAAAPALQPILNAFPLPSPNGIDYPGGLAQFIKPYSLPSKIDSTNIRIDKTVTSKWSAFFRFSDTPSQADTRSLSQLTQNHNSNLSYTTGVTTQLFRNQSNDFRLNYTSATVTQRGQLDAFGGATPIDLGQAMGVSGYPHEYPEFSLQLDSVGTTGLGTSNTYNKSSVWNINDKWSASFGPHVLKAGIDYLKISSPIQNLAPLVEAYYEDPATLVPMLANNQALSISIIQTLPATPVIHYISAFVQDEWRLHPNLSLSLGLRWEIDPPPSEAHGHDPYTILGSLSDPGNMVLAPAGTPLWHTTWYNIAPRLGVAWQVSNTPHRATVVRGGGGVFFDSDNEIATYGFNAVGFQAYNFNAGASLPVPASQINFTPNTNPPYSSVYAFPEHLQLPYTLQWNLSLQQELGERQAVTFSYVAANGRRLLGSQEASFGAANPNFPAVNYFIGNLTSNYQALQVNFQRTAATGLNVFGGYTWSHSLDFGSTAATLPIQRGNSDFDVRSNFQAGATWDIPVHSEIPGLRNVFGEWALDARVSARTAFPIPLLGNTTLNPANGTYYQGGVNYDVSKPIYLYGSQYPGGRIVNGGPSVPASQAAITLPLHGVTGNAPRNFVRGFGMQQFNVAARKNISIAEHVGLQFRAEAFNVFNKPNFGYVDSLLRDITFGQATKMLNSSLGTLASQYQQGGPRSFQFVIKLQF
jgi:Carboxypeptidase regulatory-like domain/TonB-dependent Receptor Plug Domain